MTNYTDIGVEKHGHVGLIEIRKPPLNFFDVALINQIADALEEFDRDIEIRASVLAAQGKAFCAGANFGDPARQEQEERAKSDPASNLPINHLYVQAVRIFRNKKPIVAAVHGAAIGGGLGLAVSADFRVTCPEARFAANFTKLGFHPGFGLTATLPELVRAVGNNPDTRSAEGIGRLVAQLHTMRRMSVSVAGMLQAGKEPVVEASIVKDIGTVWEQQLPHRVRDLAAFVEETATNRETLENQLSFAIKTAPKLTIQGGTTEVLRGIIARGLGLR